MSAFICVVAILLGRYAVSLANDCGSGFQVRNCSSDDQRTDGELKYFLTSDKLAMQLCPRSDSSISQWRIEFNGELSSTICSDVAFSSSNICVNSRGLVIKREQFEKKNGTYNFDFISNERTFSLQIRFAPTGVYPLYPTVHVNEGDDYANLSWLIFDSNVPNTIQSFRGRTLLTDGFSSKVDGISVVKGNECISTESGESTTVWNVSIVKPNSSAEGDYILVVNNSSSATVQLIVDSISPSSTIMIIPSTHLIGHQSPTDSPVATIIGITFSIVAVAIVCVIIIILITFAYSLKRRSVHVSSNNLDKPEIIEIPEHSSNINCPFDEMLEISFDENGLFYHSYKYGVTIIIPPGAVQQPCTLQFGACLLLPHFRSNDSFIPVSPFVWINIDTVLSKPAELYIPHYVDVSSDEDKMKLCLLTTKENSQVFTVDKVAEVSFSPTLARILTTNFCSLCVAAEHPPRKRYYLLYAEKELEDGSLYVDVCIMYSIRCLQKVKEQLKEYKENKILHRGPVSFSDDSNGISVTFDPVHVPGWIIDFRDIHCEKITEDMIDIYKVLGCTPEEVTDNDIEDLKRYEEADSYPPRFKVQFSPDDSQSENTQVTLSLHGLKNTFSRTIRLCKEYPDLYPTSPVSSLSSDTSGYDSLSPGAASSSTTSFYEVILSPTSQSSDTFLVDLMNFLESKLRSKWYQFGHHLKLPIEELHRIEVNVGQNNERCTRQILFMWRRLNPAASWEPIAEALEQSGLSLLSAIVTKRCTNPGPTFCQTCRCTHGLDYTDFDIHDVLTSIPNNSLLQSAPDISKLSDLVGAEIPAKWELFGVQVGLEQSYLDCLRDEHHDSKIRFIHLFNEWKTMKTSDFTWSTVIKVLYSKTIGEYTLAENILKKLKSSSTDLN